MERIGQVEQSNPPETLRGRPGADRSRSCSARPCAASRTAWTSAGRAPTSCASIRPGSWWSTFRSPRWRTGSASTEGWKACRRSVEVEIASFARDKVRAQIRYIGDQFRLEQALARLGLALSREGESWLLLPIGAKPQPRRAAERDVDLVLDRSPLNLANLVTLGRLLMVVPAGLADRHRAARGGVLAVRRGRRLGRGRRLHRQELQRQDRARRDPRPARRQGAARRHLPRAGDRRLAAGLARGHGARPRPSDRRRRDPDPAPRSGVPRDAARDRQDQHLRPDPAGGLRDRRCRRLDRARGAGHRADRAGREHDRCCRAPAMRCRRSARPALERAS